MRYACVLVAVTILAGTAVTAGSGREAEVRLALTLTASVSKSWTYSSTRTEENCRVRTRGSGERTLTLRSRRPTIVTARRVGSRLAFRPPAVRFLAGVVTEGGSKNEYASCDGKIVHFDCVPFRRQFAGKAARFGSPRRGVVRFAQLRSLPRAGQTTCPGEPVAVRREEPGLHSAPGRLRDEVLLDPRFRHFTATGDLERTRRFAGTTVATVHQRVRWTLTFRASR
jgi:hypothetical protein